MRLTELTSTDPPGRVPLHPRLTVVGNVGPLAPIAGALAAELGHPVLGPEDVPRPAPAAAPPGADPPAAVADELAAATAEEPAAASYPTGADAVPEPPAAPGAHVAPEPHAGAEDLPAMAAPPPQDADEPAGRNPIDAELDELRGRLGVLVTRRAKVAELVGRPLPDAGRVRDALDGLRDAEMDAERSRERRLSLADAWSDVVTRLAAYPAAVAPSAEVLDQAREAVATARAELQWADRSAGVRPTADLAELDRAHELVEAAEARAARPLSGAAARRDLAEARERERVILEGLGFLSYMDRHLTEALSRPDPTAVDRCDQARTALADADAVLGELEVMAEEATRRERLESEAAGYLAAAERLLGGRAAGDVALALRAAPDRGLDAAAAHLRRALADVDPGSTVQVGEDVVSAAQRFLAGAAEGAAVHAGLRHRLEALDRERSDLERDLDDLERQRAAFERDRNARTSVPRPAAPPAPAPAPPSAVAPPARPTPAPPEPAGAPPAPAAASAPPSAPPAPAADPDAASVGTAEFDDTMELEFFLLAHLAGHRGTDERGSVPLVLRDLLAGCSDDTAFAGLLLLERLADSVQVLYLTDEPRMHRWVAGLGEHRAASHQTGWEPVRPAATDPTIAGAIELALRESEPVVQLDPPPSAPRRRTQCQVCRSGIATSVCDHCALHLCEEHLIRTPGRRSSAPRVLCLQCGLVAAGVRRRR